MKSTIMRVIGSLCIVLLAVGLTACGGDEGGGSASGPDPDRYCELVAELEESGSAAFEAVEADEDATEEDYMAASKQFTEDSAEEFEELIEVAPDEISADVETLVGSIRAQAVGEAQAREEAAAAEERITAWEEDNC